MNEEYLLSKGWTVEESSVKQSVKLYRCPWEKGKYNKHELKYACQMQEQKDYLYKYGIYPKRIRLNDFGWGLWLVLNNSSTGHYCSYVEDGDVADKWVIETKEHLKNGYLNSTNYKTYSNNQRFGTSYDDTVMDNILIRKYGSEAYYYSIPTFPRYMETVMQLLKDEHPNGIDEYWDDIPKVPSFGLDINTIPEEFKIVAKYKIDEYHHKMKERNTYETNRATVNHLLEKYKKDEFDIAEVWAWYQCSEFKNSFQVETLTKLWKS
jgi:hypothetical protein